MSRRAKDIFLEAIEREGAQRDAYLAQACAEDAALRREVEALLAADEGATPDFLAGRERETLAASASDLHLDDVFNGFTPLRIVGEGGMGTVYEAQQAQPRRRVALKVIRSGRLTADLERRFAREAELLARLTHPHIAQLYECGTSRAGRPYFAMEFVAGAPIREFCEQQRLPLRARVELLVTICQAVDHAHQQGVIHRDLKPSNVLITQQNGQPWPKIIDFGIAKATEVSGAEPSLLTLSQQIVGTPAYMSPEQVAGRTRAIQQPSDVYALGVLLYELVSGRLPYDLRNRPLAEAARIIREEEPSHLTLAEDLSGTRSRVDRDLETIARKALEKDPARRYPSAAALAADLAHYLRNEPIVARPPSTMYQLRKFAQRHRALVTGVCGVFLALVAGIIATSYGLRQALRARDAEQAAKVAAVRSAEEAQRQARRAQAISDLLTRDLVAVKDPWRDGRDVRFTDVLDRAARGVETTLAAQPDLQAAVWLALARTYLVLGLFEPGRQYAERAHELYLQQNGPDHADTLDAAVRVMAARLGLDDFAATLPELEATAQRAAAHLPAEHPLQNELRSELATAYERSGRFEDAIALRREILADRAARLGEEHPDYWRALSALGAALMRSSRDAEAAVCFERVIAHKAGRPNPTPDSTWCAALNGLAGVRMNQGRHDEAERLVRESVRFNEQVRDPDHPDTLAALNELARLLIRRRGFAEAAEMLTRVATVYREKLGADHQFTLIAVHNLANARRQQGGLDEARAMHLQNLENRRRVLGNHHPDVAESLEALGMLEIRAQNFELGARYCEEALVVARASLPPDTPLEVNILANYFSALQRLEDWPRAEFVMRELTEMEPRILGPTAPFTLDDRRWLAETLAQLGECSEALEIVDAVIATRRDLYPEESPSLQLDLVTRGLALQCQGRFAEAERELRAAFHLAPERVRMVNRAKAARRLAGLYEAWAAASPNTDRGQEAADWRACAQYLDEAAARN